MVIKQVEITEEFIADVRADKITVRIPPSVAGKMQLKDDTPVADVIANLDQKAYVIVDRGGRFVVIPTARLDQIKEATEQISERHKLHKQSTKSSIWDKEDELLTIFPELADEFKLAKKRIEDGSCKGCAATGAANKLIGKIASLHVRYPSRQLSDELVQTLGPAFGRQIARLKYKDLPYGTIAKPAKIDGTHDVLVPLLHKHYTQGVRPSCLDCCRKHLGQAVILLQESEFAEYGHHFWLGIGHLAEAESESLSSYPGFAKQLRDIRLAMMADRDYLPSIVELFDDLDILETYENSKKKGKTETSE